MISKPTNPDPRKAAKPTILSAIDRSDVSSTPIVAARWKARNAALVAPGDVVAPKPTNGKTPPALPPPPPKRSHRKKPSKNEASSQPITAIDWKARRDAPKPPSAP